MLRDDVRRRARASLSAIRNLPATLSNASTLRSNVGDRAAALWGLVRRGVSAAAQTPFNQPIGPHRRIDWLRFDLDAVKAVKRALGGSVNDVVLATVSGAIREYLIAHRVDVAGLDFRTIVPVSVRAPDERGVPGNRVSMWMTALPIGSAHSLERHARVRATTEHFKESHEASGAEVLTQTAEWTTSLVLGLAIRLLNSAHAFNLIVTNVPGPPVPLYLLDAPMVAAYPHVPLFENQGLGIALFSYADSLYWGLVGDWDLMPDLHRLTGAIEHAFTELYDAAVATVRPRVVRRRQQVA
jgi:WS/DGAT/MGAT family acyltransferase